MAKQVSFKINALQDPSGNVLFFQNGLSVRATDRVGNTCKGMVSGYNPDGSLEVTLHVTRTGPHKVELVQGGAVITPAPFDVEVPVADLIPQAVPEDEFQVGAEGVALNLNPVYDVQGLLVWYEKEDIVCQVAKPDGSIAGFTSDISRDKLDNLTLRFAAKKSGNYVAQVYVHGNPLLSPEIRFRAVIEDSKKEVQPNPVAGQTNMLDISDVVDKYGNLLGTGIPIQELGCSASLANSVYSKECYFFGSQGHGLSLEFDVEKEGHYFISVYVRRTGEELANWYQYVGTTALRQQVANNGESFVCPMDGAKVNLSLPTDRAGIPLSFTEEDVKVMVTALSPNTSNFEGHMEYYEDCMVAVLLPPAYGYYSLQVYIHDRPLLTVELPFHVV